MLAEERFIGEETSSRLSGTFERRQGTRLHTVLRVAQVIREHDAGLWRVRNISDRGLMLAAHVQVVPGERLTVNLSRHGAAFLHDGCFRPGMAAKLHFESGDD